MKGLLLNSLYQSYKSTVLIMSILATIGAFIVVFEVPSIVVIAFAFGIVISFTIISLIFTQHNHETGWDLYTRILPMKKKTVIQSQYLLSFIYMLIGFVMNMFFVLMIVIFKGNIFFDFGMRDIITLCFMSISLAVQIISFYFILNSFLDFGGASFSILISVIFSLVFSGVIISISNKMKTTIETGRLAVWLLSVLIGILSYKISLSKVYKNNIV